jgi:hypothetical protein
MKLELAGFLVACTVVAPVSALAQPPSPSPGAQGSVQVATSFEQLRGLLKPGDKVSVTDLAGTTTTGILDDVSPSSLGLHVRNAPPGQSRWSERDVREIAVERHGNVMAGLLIGLAAGATPGLVFTVGRGRGSDPVGGAALLLIAAPAAGGAAVGALISRGNKKHTTVYQGLGRQTTRVLVSPILARTTAGVQVSWRF